MVPPGDGAGQGAGGVGGGDGETPPAADAKKKPTSAKLRAPVGEVAKRYTFQGFPIAVENAAGTTRFWKDADGKTAGQTTMLHDYGFVEGHLGEDDEELDCYIGPDEDAPDVHIVHQLRAPDFKAHDEMKVFLGFPDAAAAKDAFLAHRDDEGAFGGMTTLPLERFRDRLSRRAPDSTSRIRATAPRGRVATLRAPRVTAGRGPVATYIDQLDANAARRGSEAIRPHLEAVLKAVREGQSWGDVKARLLHLLQSSDPKKIAETMQRARIMAHLSGRAGVLDGI